MNQVLRDALVQSQESKEEPLLVPLAKFFEGNDDLGSIGCNLPEHPGINVFHNILLEIENRSDVEAIIVQINELDSGPDSWPFADKIWIAGTISLEKLNEYLEPLEPDEVALADFAGVPEELIARYGNKLFYAWWD